MAAIETDTAGNRAVCILLKCCLVLGYIFVTAPSKFDLRHTLPLLSLEGLEPNVHRLFAAVVPAPAVLVLF